MNEFFKYFASWGLVNYLIMIDYLCVIIIIFSINFIVKEAFVKPSVHDWINVGAITITSLYLIFEISYNWEELISIQHLELQWQAAYEQEA